MGLRLAVDAQLEGAAEADRDAGAVGDLLVEPGRDHVVLADLDALGLEDVADGVAEARDLLLLPVDRQGHRGGERGVAVGAAGDSEDHRGHEGGEEGLAADEGVETVVHTAPNVVLSGSRVAHPHTGAFREVCAGPTREGASYAPAQPVRRWEIWSRFRPTVTRR